MGEIVFSLFIGGYLAAVGLFMNWYLGREQKEIERQQSAAKAKETKGV